MPPKHHSAVDRLRHTQSLVKILHQRVLLFDAQRFDGGRDICGLGTVQNVEQRGEVGGLHHGKRRRIERFAKTC